MPIGTQTAPSARTVGDFRQSLVFLHVSRLPVLYILVLEVGYLLHKRPSGVLVVSEGHSPDAYRPSEGTQWDPSARTVGVFGPSLAGLPVLYPPSLYILVLVVRFFLHTQPSGMTGVARGLSPDTYRHTRRHPVAKV